MTTNRHTVWYRIHRLGWAHDRARDVPAWQRPDGSLTIESRILDALDAGRSRRSRIVEALPDVLPSTVDKSIGRLVRRGRVERVAQGRYAITDAGRAVLGAARARAGIVEALDDEQDWTPAPYVTPIRARALGIA